MAADDTAHVRAAVVGVDLGLSVTDAVMLPAAAPAAALDHVRFDTAGRTPAEALRAALAALGSDATSVSEIGVTGGRSASLAGAADDLLPDAAAPGTARPALIVVAEPEAIGRGGLALADLRAALVVSCGTGTAMIAADADADDAARRYAHASGTPVGGGTLRALGGLLLGNRDAHEICDLAAAGDASRVDTTLGEVLGSGLGTLPPDATAVSLGRLADQARDVRREDLAAALVTMVAQTIGLVAVNAVRAHGLPAVIMVGRLATLPPVRSMLRAVFAVYGMTQLLHLPDGAAHATALGAALAARERQRSHRGSQPS